MQLQVLQTDEESHGPFAFQLLSLAKLHLNPQVHAEVLYLFSTHFALLCPQM